ncbi:MAG TPA: hypothetical protein PKA63_08160 [Oligoflexia bacterium]|nr:hypothetical protein [Oligoflexia bacterium]HMP48624.1 hypothetical protein [Oligoflexia bacterium]
MKKYFFLFLFSLTFNSGCGSAKFIRSGDTISPIKSNEVSPSQIKVYTLPPQGKYLSLGIAAINILGGGMISDNFPEAIEKAKVIASQNGGNAIVINHTDESNSMNTFGSSQQRVRVNAMVIYEY